MSTLARTLFCLIALSLVLGSAGCSATPAQLPAPTPAHTPSFAKLGERIDVLAAASRLRLILGVPLPRIDCQSAYQADDRLKYLFSLHG